MHKLDRARITEPECLKDYDYRTQRWEDLGSACKKTVRCALEKMQENIRMTVEDAGGHGVRCAYCEGQIFHAGHIEHFRRKNIAHHPELCFSWQNLFLACGANNHCGHYKDRKNAPPYDPANLIKPDEHDPGHYLYFHSSGEVRVRPGLNDIDSTRASETIRVFGLNDPALVAARTRAIGAYHERNGSELEELMSWSEPDRKAYLEQEIEATCFDPYASTIKHFLQKIS